MGMTLREHAQAQARELADLLGEREGSHGDFGSNAEKAQGIKEHLASIECEVLHEAADAIAGKLSRIASGSEIEIDHWRDIAGYAMLAAGWLASEAEGYREHGMDAARYLGTVQDS